MLKPGVKRKFLIGTIAIVLGIGLGLSILMRAVLYDSLHASQAKRGLFVAASIARDSLSPLLTERYFELQMMINDVKAAAEDIAYVFIQRDDGEVLAHTFKEGFPEDLLTLNDAVSERPGAKLLESEQGRIHDFTASLIQGVGGKVHVGMLSAPIEREIDQAFLLVIGGILAAVGLGSGMAFVLATSVTWPIAELAAAVEAMERGDLRTRVAVRSDDEVGHLAAAFNRMVESRERVVAELLSSERKLQDITASLGEGVLVIDMEGILTFMNPEAERLLGWREQELIGKHLHEIVHFRKSDGSPRPANACPSMMVAETGKRTTVDDDIYIRKDGSELPVSHISAPVLDGGRIVAIVIAFQDITQRKQREAEREQLIMEHMDALSRVKVLSGMLPICSSCKKIRDDTGYWKQIESYIHDHSEAEFSHGICPECAERLSPGHFKKDR